MGTWDEGILDNDTALDGLGDLHRSVVADIETLGGATPVDASTARLSGAVGVLLQLSAYHFGMDTDSGPKIAAAVKAHAERTAALPAAARSLLEQVMAGEGKALAERPANMLAAEIAALHRGSLQAPFGKREDCLFTAPEAAAYVQEIAGRCIESVQGDFEDENNWGDLCREGLGIGCLAPLMVLEPCQVPKEEIERWRTAARQGLAGLEAEPDGELEFHRKYYSNLDRVLAALLRRFT